MPKFSTSNLDYTTEKQHLENLTFIKQGRDSPGPKRKINRDNRGNLCFEAESDSGNSVSVEETLRKLGKRN